MHQLKINLKHDDERWHFSAQQLWKCKSQTYLRHLNAKDVYFRHMVFETRANAAKEQDNHGPYIINS